MTQEDKKLLLKDLCARLPYRVKIQDYQKLGEYALLKQVDFRRKQIAVETGIGSFEGVDFYKLEWSLPYLRPMSSMTEEEKDNLQSLHDIISDENYGDGYSPSAWNAITEWEDYCNARHLDYRGLIPMGLALEAPEDMYKTE